jgi:hypothetical protein
MWFAAVTIAALLALAVVAHFVLSPALERNRDQQRRMRLACRSAPASNAPGSRQPTVTERARLTPKRDRAAGPGPAQSLDQCGQAGLFAGFQTHPSRLLMAEWTGP